MWESNSVVNLFFFLKGQCSQKVNFLSADSDLKSAKLLNSGMLALGWLANVSKMIRNTINKLDVQRQLSKVKTSAWGWKGSVILKVCSAANLTATLCEFIINHLVIQFILWPQVANRFVFKKKTTTNNYRALIKSSPADSMTSKTNPCMFRATKVILNFRTFDYTLARYG